ncbi:MAG: hypothetical protein AAB619_00740 [Patescibacteria group bacterium]
MAVELIPSITVTTAKQLRHFAALAQRLSTTVHLDVMDGKFVPTKSVNVHGLSTVTWKRKVELHAMVNDAAMLWPILDVVKPQRVYLPVERGKALRPFMAALRSRNIQCGLAIKPTTSIRSLRRYVRYAESILVLAVEPGRYRAPLQPTAVSRIRKLHRQWPRIPIVADGSMNAFTIGRAVRAGATRIIVGSAVMLSNDPLREWKKLRALTRSAAI